MTTCPAPGQVLVIDQTVDGTRRTATRTVVTVRDHGDGRYGCMVRGAGADAGYEALTIKLIRGRWRCVVAPVSIQQAQHVARNVLAGLPVDIMAVRIMAEALALLTGAAKSTTDLPVQVQS